MKTIEVLATRLVEPLTDEQGRRRFGGHSLRATGARHLASMGIELFNIQLLARWQSDVILQYVMEAPMCLVTDDHKRKTLKHLENRRLEDCSRRFGEIERLVHNLESEMKLIRTNMEADLPTFPGSMPKRSWIS